MDRQKIKDALTDAPTISAAAKRLGLSVSQLAGLLADPSLKAELDEEARQIYHESMRRLRRAADRARAVLNRALSDPRVSNSRRQAAIAILAAADRTEEHFLRESTLSQLESELAELSETSSDDAGGNPEETQVSDEDCREVPH